MGTTSDRVGAPHSYAFGRFVLSPARQLLLKDDSAVRIGGRALDILTALVERAGEVVSKSHLMAQVWSGVVVEECNLKVNMAALRKTLGDDADAARYIATVTGRGYRFIEPVRVIEASGARQAPAPAPIRSHNLPVGTTRIFGRSDVIAAIRGDLAASRLVSVVGPGGIGKTTVAVAVAEGTVSAYRDGVWLVDLSPLHDPALLPNAISSAVGATADAADVLAALCEYLRDREMLIVLDSCEHLVAKTAECVDAILAAAAGLKILTTSRELLRAKGERVRRLGGLDTPPAASDLDAGTALGYAAVQLFVDRATDRLDTFRLGNADAPAVAQLCRRLDGHALAIELAATRVAAFGVRGILQQLDARFQMSIDQRGGPARQRTLAATIDWSHELLTDTERILMRRLSAFAGAFDLEAACAVAADEHIARSAVMEGVANLVDKSLVAAEIRGLDVDYRQWDTTRSYALDKLTDSGELDVVQRRHAEHFLALAERTALEDAALAQAAWLDRHAHRLDDIRSALAWAFGPADAATLGVRLTVAAIPFWKRLSLAEECRAAAERALDERFKDHRSLHDELTLRMTLGATLLNIQGTLPEVKVTLTSALAIAESLGDRERQLECLRGLSEFELWTGDSIASIAIAERMRALAGEDKGSIGVSADAGAGSALAWLGELEASRQHLDKAINRPLDHAPRADAARFEFNLRLVALGTMIQVLWLQGFPDQAIAAARRHLKEAEASHYAWSYNYGVSQTCIMALHARDYDAAQHYIEICEKHAAKHGLGFWGAMAVCGHRARWKLYMGLHVDLEQMRSTLANMRERGMRIYYPHILTNYGEALARQEDYRGGLAAIDEAIALCEQTGQVMVIPEILRIKGNVIRFQDPQGWDRAADCYRKAVEMARSGGAPSWEIRAATSLVKLLRARGADDAQAEDMLAAAYGRFTEGFTTGDLVRARALLDSRRQTHPPARR